MKHKFFKSILFAIIVSAIVALAIFGTAKNAVGQSNASLWKLTSLNLMPVNSSWGLRVPSLNSSGTKCLQVGATGIVSAYSTGCATGGITSLNGLTGATQTFTQPTAGFSISSAGTAHTFALANDLLGLENLSTTGLAVRTGTSTWTNRTITGSTGISVVNGSGVSGDPVITNTGVTSLQGGSGAVTLTEGQGIGIADLTLYGERVVEITSDYTATVSTDQFKVFNNRGAGSSIIVDLPNPNDEEGVSFSLSIFENGQEMCFRSSSGVMWFNRIEVPVGDKICSTERNAGLTIYSQRDSYYVRQQQGKWYYDLP